MRGICVHGHFYQPPRENAWLEAVESQDSAAPYHDWNERITEECYAPNAAARVLDEDGLIVSLVSNYARMSFDFGPTLLRWLETERPAVYEAILEADAESLDRGDGHGAAMAQAYHHTILPLADERDRRTQVIWGIEDFRHRFRRDPEGMWLPEAAADTATLETLVAQGIRFTVLSPTQARRWRAPDAEWVDLDSGGSLDPRRPYRVGLPSGASIVVFFYDGPLSRRVAFDGLLRDGAALADALLESLGPEDGAALASIATDGETYGHHHRFGDMALAYALRILEERDDVELASYARFLALHPPEREAQLREPSSWSCAHGVERWRSDCGCQTGSQPGWSQAWRLPLRHALDWLRDELAALFETGSQELLRDPWAARDDYVRVTQERSHDVREAFLERHATAPLEAWQRVRVWKFLEMQRQSMMMFTSCGWFFADIAGIETRQVLQYAGRAVQLAVELGGPDLEPALLERLAAAKSNRPEARDGAHVYRRAVSPVRIELEAICANWAVARLILDGAGPGRFYCYELESLEDLRLETGRAELGLGVARVTSEVTRETDLFAYAALHMGDHQLQAGTRRVAEGWAGAEFGRWSRQVRGLWDRADLLEVRDLLQEELGELRWDLRNMFRDDRQDVLDALLEDTLDEIEAQYRRVWERHAPLMRYLAGLDVPVSRALSGAASFVVEADLHRLLGTVPPDVAAVRRQLERLRRWDLSLDEGSLRLEIERAVDAAMDRVGEAPGDPARLRDLVALVTLAQGISRSVNLWRAQNELVRLRDAHLEPARRRAAGGDPRARSWLEEMDELGRLLSVRIPADA